MVTIRCSIFDYWDMIQHLLFNYFPYLFQLSISIKFSFVFHLYISLSPSSKDDVSYITLWYIYIWVKVIYKKEVVFMVYCRSWNPVLHSISIIMLIKHSIICSKPRPLDSKVASSDLLMENWLLRWLDGSIYGHNPQKYRCMHVWITYVCMYASMYVRMCDCRMYGFVVNTCNGNTYWCNPSFLIFSRTSNSIIVNKRAMTIWITISRT